MNIHILFGDIIIILMNFKNIPVKLSIMSQRHLIKTSAYEKIIAHNKYGYSFKGGGKVCLIKMRSRCENSWSS